MNIPKFEVKQTEEDVIIVISAPCASPFDAEIFVEDTDFSFYSAPYFLRLKLPGSLMETDDSSGFYDGQKFSFTVRIAKKTKGEHFPDLDKIQPFVEEGAGFFDEEAQQEDEDEVDKVAALLQPSKDNSQSIISPILLEPAKKESTKLSCIKEESEVVSKYGFANFYSNMFGAYYYEFSEIIDLPDPDTTPAEDRRRLRMEHEKKSWSEDHYVADSMDQSSLIPYIFFHTDDMSFRFDPLSDSEMKLLEDLNKKDMTQLSDESINQVNLQLIDILFAYCYNRKTTEGENTVESAWTINKLSSTLSFFQEFTSVNDVLVSCYRRSLCYPLYRNFDLCKAVHGEVETFLRFGKLLVLKCFLEIKELFDNSEPRYLLNRLYINDFCVYIHTMLTDETLSNLSSLVNQEVIGKLEIGFDIESTEFLVNLLKNGNVPDHDKEGDSKAEEATSKMEKLSIKDRDDDDDSDDTTSSDSESVSGTSSSSGSEDD